MVLACGLAGCVGGADEPTGTALPDTSDHGEFRVHIAAPQPQFRRGSNEFTASALDAMGGAATLTSVTARMPQHGHVAEGATVRLDGAAWTISNLVLFDPGRWWITLRFTSGARYDDVIFAIDVP